MVVLKTQELAGVDVVSDGELTRFDPSHPDTNGMIDYFVSRMDGVRTGLTRDEGARFAARSEMRFRARPAGIVTGQIGQGTLDLPASYEWSRALTARPLKLTVTSPYMLARTLLDDHYRDLRALTDALADVLAAQVAAVSAPVVQVDEANLTGHPEDASWAAAPMNRVLRAANGERGAALLGADRIRWIHPDCGFWMLPRSVADRKLRALVLGRDRYLGQGLPQEP